MKFGKKAGTIAPAQTITGDWPRGLRTGETRVRFLAEIEGGWQEYWEHYDDTAKYFPCTEDRQTCPGCTSPEERTKRASKRYLAPVLDPKTGRTYGLKIPLDLANRLSLRNDRNGGTITNRDYTLIRTGQGLDTEYDVEQEEKVAIDLAVYAGSLDLEEMLASQFAAAWPDFNPDQPNGVKATPRKRAPRKVTPTPAEVEAVADKAGYNDDPPSEAPAKSDGPVMNERTPGPDDDAVMELSEDDLRKMPRPELIKLARRAELPITLTMTREAIVEMFLDQFGG